VPRFGKDKNGRNEELDRQAAEEVERLTRRGMPGAMPGMPGMPGMGGGPPRVGPPSPLEMMAAEVADRPPPSQRRAQPARRPAARPQQAFTPMPSGEVGSSFGPGGLNPGPRGGFAAPPPPAFGGGAYDDDYGGHVTGPPVYNAGEPDEEEEMSITEMALMDHAARTGFDPEDLVMTYDATNAEEMRDEAMRKFYERQQARRPGAGTNDPFAPAGQRRGPSGPAGVRRVEDPKAAGGALAQRLAARRRREEEEAGRAGGVSEPPAARARPTVPSAASASAPPAAAERAVDEGALSRVLARRRAALGVDAPTEPEPESRRHAPTRAQQAPTLRAVPEPEPDDDDAIEEAVAATPAKKAPAKRASKKAAPAEPLAMPPAEEPPAAKAPAKRTAKKAAVADAPAEKAPAKRTTKKAAAAKAPAAKATKAGATLAPAKKAPAKTAAARPAGKAKTVFCIECGEKNPAIAKFCFNCGTRLAAPEG
jgi:hypothetical protein